MAKKKTKREPYGQLSGLPGVKAKALPAYPVSSVTDTLRCIREYPTATTAGDNGAINVWRDDEGNYRCEFMRYMHTLSSVRMTTLAAVRKWLRTWWPHMQR